MKKSKKSSVEPIEKVLRARAVGAYASGPLRELGTSANVGEYFTPPTTADDIPIVDDTTTHSMAHDTKA